MENNHAEVKFRQKYVSFSFDLDPMALILKLNLDMVKMSLYTKNEVRSYSSSKDMVSTDRLTDPTEIITYPHTRVVKIQSGISKAGKTMKSNWRLCARK